jgi:hypothetical protein
MTLKFKIVYIVLIVLLSGCSVKGEVIYSQGLIVDWAHSDFKNSNDGVEILFSVENKEYLKLNETLLGVVTKDRMLNVESRIGKKPFIIKVEVKSNDNNIYIRQNSKLIMMEEGLFPNKIKIGVDKIKSGRISRELVGKEYSEYLHINNKLEEFDHDWLWFEFDTITPHPSTIFTLLLDVKNGENKRTIKAIFSPEVVNIYHH